MITYNIIELLTKLKGYNRLPVIVDKYLKYLKIILINMTYKSEDISIILYHNKFKRYKYLRVIISDRDLRFLNKHIKKIVTKFNINMRYSTVYQY